MKILTLSTKSIYEQWGLTGSPFQTTALPPNDLGATLLTGRDEELQAFAKQLVNVPKFPTIEGLNGVGKTSIANVAGHLLFRQHLAEPTGPLFIPCRKIFQLTPGKSVAEFADEVFFEVAQTLIERAKETERTDIPTAPNALNKWLNSPQLHSFQGGFQLATFGANGGHTAETNTSKGFERSGFRKSVTDWLENIFPNPEDGGIICVIDNLELLQSSDDARALIEQVRDELFNVRGLRWVLCGALGIVYGVVASPRLEGYLQSPIPVGEISDAHAGEILSNRVKAFTRSGHTSTLPLLSTDFAQLYKLLQGILRSVLSSADDYCAWIDSKKIHPATDIERHELFEAWLKEQCSIEFEAIQKQLRPSAFRVFQHAISIGGIFSPSDFESFGFKGIPQFRPSIRDLEAVGLLVSTRDEGDKRRKTIQITAKGWKVNHHIKTAQETIITKPEDESTGEVETPRPPSAAQHTDHPNQSNTD